MQPDLVVVTQRHLCRCEPEGAMQYDPNEEWIHNNLQNIRFIPGATDKPTIQRLLDHAIVETLEGDDVGVCPNIFDGALCGQPIRYFK